MRRLLVLAIVAASMFATAAPATAAKPQQVTGTEMFVLTPTCDPAVSCRTADGNVFITLLNPAVKTGTFTGTQMFDGTVTAFKNGDFVFHGIVTFEGTVEGCGEGTVVFFGAGAGNFETGLSRSTQRTLARPGTLGVHANLTLTDTAVPGTSDVTGTYHC